MASALVRFRPHHFLCSLGYEGKGYSDGFTENMTGIVMGRLRAEGGDATPIRVVGAADDICAPCPKRRGTLCTTQDKIKTLDRAHAAALHLKPHEEMTWGEAKARIRSRRSARAANGSPTGCARPRWHGSMPRRNRKRPRRG
jgi:uncharacterized protein